MAYAETLMIDPEAQRLHTIGLQAGLDGEYLKAHKQLETAQQLLATRLMLGSGRLQDIEVQSAHIGRDNGLTYAREAIAKNDTVFFDLAQARITESFGKTRPMVNNIFDSRGVLPDTFKSTPRQERIISQHGATVSTVARIATARAVMEGVDTRYDDKVASDAIEPYEHAHDLLQLGNNGYYLVSNAMVAARQERLNGGLPDATRWLGRAANGLLWTARHDRDNLKAATLTTSSRVRHLRSYQAAKDSVFAKP